VCGYIRPIQQWNDGMRESFNDRVMFDVDKSLNNLKTSLPLVNKV
jgi:hypothetical protein